MTDPSMLLDVFIATLMLFLAWKAMTSPRLYQAAILFIAFGLTMALAWSRLSAPDVALAEAAIGTGLLGVFLIDSLRAFSQRTAHDKSTWPPENEASEFQPNSSTTLSCLILAGTTLTGCLVAAILSLPESAGLTEIIAENKHHSGVEHPVTAVLLNFRGFDTWLEIGVLLVAMLGIFCVSGIVGFTLHSSPHTHSKLLEWLVRGLAPFILLVSFYLLWLGKHAPGGAFQAGVVLGAGIILLRMVGIPLIPLLPTHLWKTSLLLGFGSFLTLGLISLTLGKAFLEFPPQHAATLILTIETAATISIGFTLACYFEHLNPPPQHPQHISPNTTNPPGKKTQ